MEKRDMPTYEELATENAWLREENRQLREKVVALEEAVSRLEDMVARLMKNSSNSSKPPSSDIVKPGGGGKGGTGRRIGGQPGHKRCVRVEFGPDEIDEVRTYGMSECPACGGAVDEAAGVAPRVVQQVELAPRPIIVTEHRGAAYRCVKCGRIHYAPLPREVEACGLTGPRLKTVAGYLKGRCHCSYTAVAGFFHDVLGVRLSDGYLAKTVAAVSEALAPANDELRDEVRKQPCVNIDETGHKDRKEKHWIWAFRAADFALFHIDKSRGSQVLEEILGAQFGGTIGSDYWGAYHKYTRENGAKIQYCHAHLIRDIKFIADLPDRAAAAWAGKLLALEREMFAIIHNPCEPPGESQNATSGKSPGSQNATDCAQRAALAGMRERIITAATTDVPTNKHARNLARRFTKNGPSYFTDTEYQ